MSGDDDILRAAVKFAHGAVAASTAGVYRRAFNAFQAFCAAAGLPSMPASRETVARWITTRALQGAGGGALRDLAAVRHHHLALGHDDPGADAWVRRVADGIVRDAASKRAAQPKEQQRAGLPTEAVRAVLAGVASHVGVHGSGASAPRTSVQALRDAAVLSLGLRLMRRPGELCDLRLDDLEWTSAGGVIVTVRKSKTDQAGRGLRLPIEVSDSPTCPVRLLQRWLRVRRALATAESEEWLFVSDRGEKMTTTAVTTIVQRAAALAGLQGRFSGHSLRIGGASAAMGAGTSLATIQAVGGWSSDAVHRYLRPELAARQLGLTKAIGL